MTTIQKAKIHAIEVGKRLRGTNQDWVIAFSKELEGGGKLPPITLWRDGQILRLEAGLHRLEAHKLAGFKEVEYILSDAKSEDDAMRGEVYENILRNELNAFDRAHHLAELKAVYERQHPETKKGTAGANARHGSANVIFTFAEDTAANIGLSVSAIQKSVKIWNSLSADSKSRIPSTWIESHQSSLIGLSDLKAPMQKKVLDLLLSSPPKATNVPDALFLLENGKLYSNREKKLASINKTLTSLDDDVFEAVLAAQHERVEAWLKRTGRIK